MDSPLQYSKSRDVHSVGNLFLQMLVGWSVMEMYPSPKLALQSRLFLLLSSVGHTPMTNTLGDSFVISVSNSSHRQHAQSEQEERIHVSIFITGYGDERPNATPRVQGDCNFHPFRYEVLPTLESRVDFLVQLQRHLSRRGVSSDHQMTTSLQGLLLSQPVDGVKNSRNWSCS